MKGFIKIVSNVIYWMAAITSFIVDEEYKYIHGANFGHLMIIAIEPEHLV